MRYCEEVLKSLALPFFCKLNSQIHDPDNIELDHYLFQQDNALSYSSCWTKMVLKNTEIPLLEHIGNLSDMNAIEQAWMPL